MAEIKDRLTEATKECLQHYDAWSQNKKDESSREQLMEALHELRKVSARLEIEMAVSERDLRKNKPIPVPPHRSAKRKVDNDGNDNSAGNKNNDDNNRPCRWKPSQSAAVHHATIINPVIN